MDKCADRLRSRRSLISGSAMGALIAGTLALTACGGGGKAAVKAAVTAAASAG